MKILAVDDDPIIHDLLQAGLESQGYSDVTRAEDAEEALSLIDMAAEPFDTFLLDIMLPEIDGVELCSRIRTHEQYRMTPIIMVTANREESLMERAFSAGATDYVTKPFDGLELGTRINLAAMLNQSIMRERQSLNRLEEMARMSQIGFDDRVALTNVYGVSDILAIENQLLRSTSGCYAMSLFAVELTDAFERFSTMSAAQFRHDLECAAGAIADCVNMATTQIAYAGRGKFVLVQHGRRRVDIHALGEDIIMRMKETWRPVSAAARSAPTLEAMEISGNRLWSGMAASNALVSFLARDESERDSTQRAEEEHLSAAMRKRMFDRK
ncbi:MAG: PleD family two-component system response regulator [Arenibacterium sp.]